MNNFLGAIKNGHLFLMLVSAAVLLFALSPNDLRTYTAAQNAAALIKTLNYRDYVDYLVDYDGTTQVLHDAHEFATEVWRVAKWRTKQIVTERKALISPNMGVAFSKSSPFTMIGFPFVISKPPTSGATLEQIADFATNASSLEIVVPGRHLNHALESWSSIADEILSHSACVAVDKPPIRCRDLPGPVTVDHAFIETGRLPNGYSPLGSTVFYREVIDQPGELFVRLTARTGTYDAFPSVDLWTERSRFSKGSSSNEMVRWLQARRKLSTLVGNENGEPVFAPALQPVWSTVAYKTPQDAIDYLQHEIDQARSPMSLLGLAIDERVVLSAGPMAILVTSIYLLTLLRTLLISIRRSNLSGSSLAAYPWVGLFNDALSVVTSVVAILILPPVISALLVVRYWDGLEPASTTALIATTAIVASTIATGYALTNLRHRFAEAQLSLSSRDDS